MFITLFEYFNFPIPVPLISPSIDYRKWVFRCALMTGLISRLFIISYELYCKKLAVKHASYSQTRNMNLLYTLSQPFHSHCQFHPYHLKWDIMCDYLVLPDHRLHNIPYIHDQTHITYTKLSILSSSVYHTNRARNMNLQVTIFESLHFPTPIPPTWATKKRNAGRGYEYLKYEMLCQEVCVCQEKHKTEDRTERNKYHCLLLDWPDISVTETIL